jgi:hypothetical protein
MPIALDATTVQHQTSVPFASDSMTFNPSTNSFVAGPDHLPEVTVYLTTSTPPAGVTSSAAVLNIGTTDTSDVANQIVGGVLTAQLAGSPFNGAFILTPNAMTNSMSLDVPGNASLSSGDQSTLQTALSAVALPPNLPRIWPLFSGYDNSGNPIVTGFIAMRLIAAKNVNDMTGSAMRLTMQPTLFAEPTTVTNPAYRGYAGVPNVTIAKIRLVP